MILNKPNYIFRYWLCDDCGQGIPQEFSALEPDRCPNCKSNTISKQKSTKPNPFKERAAKVVIHA